MCPSSTWTGSCRSFPFSSTWTSVLPLPALRPEMSASAGARPLLFLLGPPGTTQLVESLAKEAEGTSSSQSGGLD